MRSRLSRHRQKLLVVAVGVLLAGAASGYALGGYVTGGEGNVASKDDWWSSEASADAAVPNSAIATPEPVAGPEHYVCKGCGPTLAERRSYGDDRAYASTAQDYVAAHMDELPSAADEKVGDVSDADQGAGF